MATKFTTADYRRQRVIAWVLLGVGVLLVGFGLWFLGDASASNSWPSTEGNILRVTIKRDMNRRSTGARPEEQNHYYEITYRYTIAGKSYTSSRFSLGEGNRASEMFEDRATADKIARERHLIGSPLAVYFNPEDPSSTVLQTGVNWGTWMPIVIGALFLGLGGFLLKSIPREDG